MYPMTYISTTDRPTRTDLSSANNRMRAIAAASVLLTLVACTRAGMNADVSTDAFTVAVNDYLAQRGNLCLGKAAWPIDVTQHEIESGARNALQMPVLEKLGLVAASVAEIEVDDEGTKHRLKVRRYDLTEAGRKFYVPRPGGTAAAPASGDFCAAKLSLERIVGWNIEGGGAQRQAVVTYTYRIDAAPWTRDADVQRVFPVVASVVRGAGSAQLQQAFAPTASGWRAVGLQGS